MVNVLAPARSASALYARPWMGQTGTYPGAAQGNALMGMAQPAAPQAPMAPQMPFAPMYAGAQAIPGAGFQGDGADVGGQPSVEHPDQSVGAMLGTLGTVASFGISPFGTMAGLLAGMAYDDTRGQQIGTTRGFVDMAFQTAGMPTVGQLISNAYGSVFGGDPSQQFSGEIGAQISPELTDALLGAPAMNAGLIGGNGGMGGHGGGAPSGPGDMGGGFGGPGGHGGPENY